LRRGASAWYTQQVSVNPPTQAAKLGLKPGQRVGLHHRPPGWTLTHPPDGLADADRGGPSEPADVIIAFFGAADEIPGALDGLARRIYPAGALWVAWPRRAGGHRSDITDTVIRRHALPIGLVDVKVAAIDDDWSGLRLVWRAEHRPRLFLPNGPWCARRSSGDKRPGSPRVRLRGSRARGALTGPRADTTDRSDSLVTSGGRYLL
jgi:hypothetical protein